MMSTRVGSSKVFDPVDVLECAHNFMIYFTDVCIEGHIVVKVNTEVLYLAGGLNSRVVKCECCVLSASLVF